MKACDECDIVFSERNCPLCEAKKEIEGLQKQIAQLEVRLEEDREDEKEKV